MARPHPALIEIAAGRPPPGRVDDPEILFSSAVDHRMHGLLWSAVMRGEIGLPLNIERVLAALDLELQARHRRLTTSMHQVAQLLASHGIEVATFKGVAAEARWYDRVGERPTRDVDLWLSPHQLDRVEETVHLLQPDHRLSGHLQKLTGDGHLQSIDVKWNGIWIDLHVDPFKLGIPIGGLDVIWGNRVKSDSGLDMLGPAASLVQFLLHLNKDRFSWLLGMADIHRVFNGGADLDEAVRIADSEGLMVPVSKSMDAVESVLGACLSSPLPKAVGWRATTWDLLWRDHLRLNGDVGFLRAHRRQNLIPLLATGRLGEGLRFNLRTVFPAPYLLDEYYPEVSGPYLLRLWRGRATRWVERRQMIRGAHQQESEEIGRNGSPLESASAQPTRRGSKRGSFVVLVGPDGSGKTTLAKALLDQAGEAGCYFHFIPEPLNTLEHYPSDDGQLLVKNREHGSRILGLVRIGRNWARAWISYFLAIRPAVRAGSLVVGDRWLYGYVGQPWSLKYHGPSWLSRFVVRYAPRPDLTVVLGAPIDVIAGRKGELTREEIESEQALWAGLSIPTSHVDASRPPAQLTKEVLDLVDVGRHYKKYPPLLGNVLIPATPRSSALVGTSLYAATRRRARIAHGSGRAMIKVFGTSWLASPSIADVPLQGLHRQIVLDLLSENGLCADDFAIYTRTQTDRRGYSLLAIRNGAAVGFVRVGPINAVVAEERALLLLERFGSGTFVFPRALGRTDHGDLAFALISPILMGAHAPSRVPPLESIVADVQVSLRNLPREPGVPRHWVPMHGDFTPWNLRQVGGRVALIDWEDAGWGPPGADLALYSAARDAVGLRTTTNRIDQESARFWLDRLGEDLGARDSKLRIRLRQILTQALEDTV